MHVSNCRYKVEHLLTQAKIGDIAFEQAVLIDFPLQTAVAALHVFLGMGKPNSSKEDGKVLIWGAGGAVGSYAVQFAKQVNPSHSIPTLDFVMFIVNIY